MKHKLVLLLIVLLMGWSAAYAGNPDRTGTAGAQELLIPVGSRGTAMGGAAAANSEGVDALYWNPAGLATILEGSEAMFSHLPYIADIDVEYAAFGTNIEDFGTVAFSVKVVNIGEIEETTEAQPEGTGRIFNPTLTVMGLSWAKAFTHNINFGFTGHVIRETIFEVSATGVAFDFGFTYATRFEGLTLGFVMKNYGPDMTFRGKGFDRIYEDVGKRPVSSAGATFELPTSINISAAYDVMSSGLSQTTVVGNFRANNQAQDRWQGGVEYSYDSKYFLRGGYKYSDQADYLYGVSLGGGITYPLGNSDVSIEYTWQNSDRYFDNNQFFTFRVSF